MQHRTSKLATVPKVGSDLTRPLESTLEFKRREVLGIYRKSLRRGPSQESSLKALQVAARYLMAGNYFDGVKCDATGSGDSGWIDIGGFPWERVEAKHLVALSGDLTNRMNGKVPDPVASTSINKYISTVRGLLRLGFTEGLISADAVQRLREVKSAKGGRPVAGRALSDSEVALLLDACDLETNKGVRDYAIVSVLYGCGLRRDEIGTITMAAYNGAQVSVVGKGGKHRNVPVDGDAPAAIARWLRVRGPASKDDPLFPRLNAGISGKVGRKRISSAAIFQIIKDLMRKSKIEDCSPHDLRRTYASDFLEAGGDLPTLQRLMGHADVKTTARYDRRHERLDADAAARLAEFRKKRAARGNP